MLCCVALCCVVLFYIFQVEKQVRSLKRRARTNLLKERIVDPEDNAKYLVYPVEENSQDAIEIYRGDLKRLKAPQYLNDSLIDLKIKLIIRDLPEEKRTKVRTNFRFFYFFTYVNFFSRLQIDVIFRYSHSTFSSISVMISIMVSNHYQGIMP